MSGNEIKFQFMNETISFSLNDDGSVKEEGIAKKQLKKLLFDIKNSDNNPEITQKEFEMIKNLKTIFGKIGETRAEDGSDWLDKADIEFLEKWETAKKQGQKIDVFLNAELAKLEPVKINIPAPELKIDLPKPEFQGLTEQKPFVPKEPTQADKNAQFNRSMQILKQRYNKDELDFTQEVQYVKGKYLSHIAKEALQAEGRQKPTAQQINERIAQIALVNDISDVNNVPESKFPLKVGTGRTALVQGDGNKPDQRQEGGQKIVGASSIKTGAVPVETPAGGITIKPDPDTTGWAKKDDAQLPDGITQEALNGGTLVTFTKGEGENVETKYTYEKDRIKVEAATVDELKTKIETIKTALEDLEKTAPDTETEQEKATRIQGYENAIDTLLEIGTEQAVLKAQAKLAAKKAYVSAEFYEEKTIAMINSGNVALIEQMFNVPEGIEIVGILLNHVNNNPKIQDAIGAKIVELREKYNNSTITLDEQKILTTLDDYVDVPGIWILAKDPVAEVNDAEGNVTTPASAEVFEKEYKTDTNGNSAYHAKFKLGENDLTFKAKDAETLDSFLTELKVANTETDDAKKTQALQQVFSTYALNGTDSELVKSLAENASKFKATVGDLTALANKSNLDVIYAIDSSHLEDRAQGANGDNDSGCTDETTFETVKRTHIEYIMGKSELAKLPENAKYLERIAGVDIAGKGRPVRSVPDYQDWSHSVPLYVKKNEDGTYSNCTAETEGAIEYYEHTKDDKIVYTLNYYVDKVEGGERKSAIEAESLDEALKLKEAWDAFELTRPAEGASLTPEQKQEILNKLVEIAKLNLDYSMLHEIAEALKTESLIDHDAPEAKALVQQLLLTRDSNIVLGLTHKLKNDGSDYEPDNTLFEKDPVALKTLAAMFKEIRDLENQGVRLTPEQIALKDVLDDLDSGKKATFGGAKLEDGVLLRFDGEGNLAVRVDDGGRVAMNATTAEKDNTPSGHAIIDDPILSKDKHVLAGWGWSASYGDSATKDQILKFIGLDTVDAELLSGQDIRALPSSLSKEDREEITNAYVAKAKALYTFAEPAEGEKLDPANARYLFDILENINKINESAGANTEDPDRVVAAEILGNFFVTEGENATVKLKDFRRFTYEEMEGLVSAVACYGNKAQKEALADMITLDEMEDGQFARAIVSNRGLTSEIRAKFIELADNMTTKEEVLDFISNMEHPQSHIPFDKIMEKFGKEPEVVAELLKYIDPDNVMSDVTRKELLEFLVVDEEVKIPEGVDATSLYDLLPQEKAATADAEAVTMDEKAKKVFEHLVKQMDAYDIDGLRYMYFCASQTAVLRAKVEDKVAELFVVNLNNPTVIDSIYESFENVVLDRNLWLKQAQWADGATTVAKTADGNSITNTGFQDLYNDSTMISLQLELDRTVWESADEAWNDNKDKVKTNLTSVCNAIKTALPANLDQDKLDAAITNVISSVSGSCKTIEDNSLESTRSNLLSIASKNSNRQQTLKIVDIFDDDWCNSHLYAIDFKMLVDKVMDEYKYLST